MLRARRPSGDSGAAAVEFALLFPIFMILALGTISGGIAFSKQITVTQGAREASRYGATYDVQVAGGIDPWLVEVRNAARQAVGGASDPLGGFDDLCVAYVQTTSTGTVDTTRSKFLRQNGVTGAGACPTTAAAPIKSAVYVQTAITRRSDYFVLFLNKTLDIDSVSVTPYEGRPIP